MRSPFPGMDPYLEPRWSSFHLLLLGAITAQLQRSLPPGLEARPEEEVRIETAGAERPPTRRPDVAIVEWADAGGVAVVTEERVATSVTPIRIRFRRRQIRTRNIQIVDATDGARVVTAIEVLSPFNKAPGKLNRAYRKKLRQFDRAGTNWVEIDLLRSRRDRMSVDWHHLPSEARGTYLAVAHRAKTAELEAYPIGLRSRLPLFAIPLRGRSESVNLDLQVAFDRAWDDGPFRSIDYSQPVDPPLSADDASWLAGLLVARAEGAST